MSSSDPDTSPPRPLFIPPTLTIRHCDCVYYQDWHRTRPLRPPSAANFKPGVHRLPPPTTNGPAARDSMFSNGSGESSIPPSGAPPSRVNGDLATVGATGGSQKGLPFDEEAKLVYGVVLSLRNMVKKLSGK